MSDAPRLFGRIETNAKLPDGQTVTARHDFPAGAGRDVYDAIDAQLVRDHGNDGTRTVGIYLNEEDGCIKSDRTRRDGRTPSPCIACGKQLDSAANDPHFDGVPYKGTMFGTSGHYGSTVFDSFDGWRLEIVVCDDCLAAHAAERVRLISPAGDKTPWDGVTDGDPSDG